MKITEMFLRKRSEYNGFQRMSHSRRGQKHKKCLREYAQTRDDDDELSKASGKCLTTESNDSGIRSTDGAQKC